MNRLKSFIGLSLAIARAEFKLKNEGSYLGIIWYLLGPLLMFGLLLLIFSSRVGVGIEKYPLYLLLGLIIFNLFQKSTADAVAIIKNHGGLIKSIRFPHMALCSAATLKVLFSHIFEVLIFIAFILFFKNSLFGLLFYPFILFFFLIFIYGSSLILSSLGAYFSDIQNIWVFVSRLIWLGTPIFYAVEGQNRLLYVNLMNPMYYFITISREIIIYSKMPEIWMILAMMVSSLLFLVMGIIFFNKLKRRFAELV